MLHILWILIKFILILLGILLGLVLLAVLLVLFCPVRYSAAAAKEGDSFKEAEIEARVSWLFRAIGVRFFFNRWASVQKYQYNNSTSDTCRVERRISGQRV